MASEVNRRRFLKSAGTGIAAGAAAAVTASALASDNPASSPSIPLPDAQTKPAPTAEDLQVVCAVRRRK